MKKFFILAITVMATVSVSAFNRNNSKVVLKFNAPEIECTCEGEHPEVEQAIAEDIIRQCKELEAIQDYATDSVLNKKSESIHIALNPDEKKVKACEAVLDMAQSIFEFPAKQAEIYKTAKEQNDYAKMSKLIDEYCMENDIFWDTVMESDEWLNYLEIVKQVKF